jgi:hypothetical protein
MEPSIAAISMPSVVMNSAIHLWFSFTQATGRPQRLRHYDVVDGDGAQVGQVTLPVSHDLVGGQPR